MFLTLFIATHINIFTSDFLNICHHIFSDLQNVLLPFKKKFNSIVSVNNISPYTFLLQKI